MAELVCEIISEWKQDQLLQNDIKKYVLGNLKRSEILDFVTRDYPQYTWSLSSLLLKRGDLHTLISNM